MELTSHNDGIDHINIYSKGKTSLGRALTNMHLHTFEYAEYVFHSVEQAWHFYKLKDFYPEAAKHILTLESSFDCLKYARLYKSPEVTAYVQTDAFKNQIEDVIRVRLETDSQLKVQLKNSYLPFKHYYVYGDNHIQDQSDKYDWLLDIFERIRTELQFEYLDVLLAKYGSSCYNMQTAPSNAVYVGRPKAGAVAIYGNPFPVAQEFKALKNVDDFAFDKAVALSVIQFRHHLTKLIMADPKAWYKNLKNLQNKNYKCFCNDGSTSREDGGRFCHSLILAQFSDNCDEIYKAMNINVNN